MDSVCTQTYDVRQRGVRADLLGDSMQWVLLEETFVSRSAQHVCVRCESERLFIEVSLKMESKAECAIVWVKMCEKNVLVGFRVHPSILRGVSCA